MAVPATMLLPLIQGATQLLREQTTSRQNQQSFLLSQKRLEAEQDAQLYTYLARLEQIRFDESRVREQAAIMRQMLEGRERFNAERIRLIERFFDFAANFVIEHQSILKDELERVSKRQDNQSLSKVEKEVARQESAEIREQLENLSVAVMDFSSQWAQIVNNLSSSHTPPKLPNF